MLPWRHLHVPPATSGKDVRWLPLKAPLRLILFLKSLQHLHAVRVKFEENK
jgi:hypothetical protein